MGILPWQMGNHIYCGGRENKQGSVMELEQKPKESIKGLAEGRNTLNKQMGYRELLGMKTDHSGYSERTQRKRRKLAF